MFNSGTVDSIVAEAVHERDEFQWSPGVMRTPEHRPDWFGDRGNCVGAYAYAVFKGGAISKVVVVGGKRIRRAMSASDGADSPYSPWKRDYEKMVIKTALHDLEPYVPKSAESQRLDATARAAALQVVQEHPELEGAYQSRGDVGDPEDARIRQRVTAAEIIDGDTGEITEAPAEVDGWPPVTPVGGDK
jgi:recombination protein RecT